jgi:hypothetical protein
MTNTKRSFLLSDIAVILYLALFKLILHLLFYGNYGYFRDELYFLDCANHPAWGYVDQPPLSIAVLNVVRWLFGDSLLAIRLPAAVAGATVVFLTGLMARKVGGHRFAQVLAAIVVIAAPVILGQDRYFSMNAFDFLFWTLAAYLVIVIIKDNNPRMWLPLGLVLGLGLLNKYSMGFFCIGLVAGLLLTSNRDQLKSKWFWAGVLLSFLIFLPHISWEIKNGLPSLEFLQNAERFKNTPIRPIDFVSGQFREIGYAAGIVWLGGLYFCFLHKEGRQYRILAWIYSVIFALMITHNAKVYYLAPVYPMLLATGGVFIESLLQRFEISWAGKVLAGVMILMGIISAPFAIPVLPVETFIQYQKLLRIRPGQDEREKPGILPQNFADMFGWEDMVGTIAKAFNSLSPQEQAKCAIIANNYGEAGAINFFGRACNLPNAISGHNNYWLWGPGDATGEIVLRLGGSVDSLHVYYKEVIRSDTVRNRYCMPYESNLPVYICKGRFVPLKESWPEFRHYD